MGTLDELHLLQQESKEVDMEELYVKPSVIIRYGGYINWGRENHNPSRLGPLIDLLKSRGYGVEIEHDETRMSIVEVLQEEGLSKSTVPVMQYSTLTSHNLFQHNQNFRKRHELASEMLAEMEEKLQYQRDAQKRVEAAVAKAEALGTSIKK